MTDLTTAERIRGLIRDVPDFPKPGIVFKDLCPVWGSGDAMAELAVAMSAPYDPAGVHALVGIESRGFLVGTAMSMKMGKGLVLVRKKGKLPGTVVSRSYDLEYGQDTLEVQANALRPGMKVVMVDDLLATGGTMKAAMALVESQGAEIIGVSFVVELGFLEGRKALGDTTCYSLVRY
ncbi:MAG: adenine phosphoribosyltransferase [Myxococcales bacterium]|nr:adenine phosphoribosyltransferase [Myxococcales bacterium]